MNFLADRKLTLWEKCLKLVLCVTVNPRTRTQYINIVGCQCYQGTVLSVYV